MWSSSSSFCWRWWRQREMLHNGCWRQLLRLLWRRWQPFCSPFNGFPTLLRFAKRFYLLTLFLLKRLEKHPSIGSPLTFEPPQFFADIIYFILAIPSALFMMTAHWWWSRRRSLGLRCIWEAHMLRSIFLWCKLRGEIFLYCICQRGLT